MLFTELSMDPRILQGLTDAGFTEPTPVQAQTWKLSVVDGRDITVQSQTGTGKTGAFLIPTFHHLVTEGKFFKTKALIVAPTRELAVQIYEEAQLLGAQLPLKYGCVYGGVGYGQQETMLKDGVDILIGTPGRLLDFISSKKVDPKEFGVLIIDEADRLLDMGFFPDMQKIFRMMKPREERMTMLLSATISTRVTQLTWEYMNQPANIEVVAEKIALDSIEQVLYHVSQEEKFSVLLGILKTEKPDTAIIFCNTKRSAEEVAKRLVINEIPANYIMGDLPQSKRLRIIQEIKEKKVKVLVATDVAARGLHVDALDMVINYDLPDDAENYVHRIGRTARAGESGKARTLACEKFVYNLPAIEKYINSKLPTGAITDEMVAEDKSKGMRIRLDSWDDDGRDRDRGPSNNRQPRDRNADVRHARDSRVKRAVDAVAGRIGDEPKEPYKKPHSDKAQADRPRHAKRHIEGKKEHVQVKKQTRSDAPRPGQGSMDDRIAYYRNKFSGEFGAVGKEIRKNAQQQPNKPAPKREDNRPKVQKQAKAVPKPNPATLQANKVSDTMPKPANRGFMGWIKRLFHSS